MEANTAGAPETLEPKARIRSGEGEGELSTLERLVVMVIEESEDTPIVGSARKVASILVVPALLEILELPLRGVVDTPTKGNRELIRQNIEIPVTVTEGS